MNAPSHIPDGYDFLGHLYDAVMAPDGFRVFIDKLVEVLNLRAVTMIIRHAETHEVKALWLAGSITQAWSESYVIEYAQDDVLASHIMQSPIAQFYASNLDVRYPDNFSSTRFYTEWLEPQGVAYAAGAVVLQEGPWLTQLILQRRREQPPFTREEMTFLNQLIPHLQRAIQMRQRLEEVQMDKALLVSGLDALAVPTLLFNEQQQVVHANGQARTLLEAGTLQLQDGRLQLPAGEVARQIVFRLSQAVAASREEQHAQRSVIHLPRAGQMPLALMILGVRPEGASSRHGAALMFVFDPAALPSLAIESVQALFRLSPTEAQLAVALCCGKTLDEFAVERGTSLHTVRSQLKNIYLKTGTHRQTHLVAMLLASPAFFLTSHDK